MATTERKQKGKVRQAPQIEEPGTIASPGASDVKRGKSLLAQAAEISSSEIEAQALAFQKLQQKLNALCSEYARERNPGTFKTLYESLRKTIDDAEQALITESKGHELIGRYLFRAENQLSPKTLERLSFYEFVWFRINRDRERAGKPWTSSAEIPATEIAQRIANFPTESMIAWLPENNGCIETSVRAISQFLKRNGYPVTAQKYP